MQPEVVSQLLYRLVTLSSRSVLHVWRSPTHETRALIVLQHGFTEYAERYTRSHQQLVHHLCVKGYVVYAMDIWGHGSSPGIPRGVAHVGKAVHDHVEVRRLAAAERLPIFLMGFSLGGLVTAASFVQEPTTNTKGIILMYPALPEAQSSFVRGILGFGSWIMPNASLPVKGVPYQDHTRDLVEVQLISEDPFMIKRALPFLLAKTALEEAEKVWAGLDTWNTSTLVMHGTADLATNPHTSEFFVSQITAGDKKLRLWEDCRHELLNDLSGRGVLAELLQWLRERTR